MSDEDKGADYYKRVARFVAMAYLFSYDEETDRASILADDEAPDWLPLRDIDEREFSLEECKVFVGRLLQSRSFEQVVGAFLSHVWYDGFRYTDQQKSEATSLDDAAVRINSVDYPSVALCVTFIGEWTTDRAADLMAFMDFFSSTDIPDPPDPEPEEPEEDRE